MTTEQSKVPSLWISICVIAVVAFVTFCAVPNFIRAPNSSGKPMCYPMLLQIDEAKEQCALEKKLLPGDSIDEAAVATYIKGGFPKCPQGGRYTLGKVGEPPRCDFPLHAKFHESLVRRNDSISPPSK
jgi:hypothetical protein